ncbi:vWA domain-containing protein [Entomobacter blattae]|uniref:VWFA domain-containing protein n=1 Tax=Entomobacter blattae TaxID=2762277 RepID=A0A7H1NQC6_9PROT|nr:vWA domain-containing protein [Entomobacter blattae]QNT77986.1 hypothetical protein JGUZn3_07510 [Entomobacter blattae]
MSFSVFIWFSRTALTPLSSGGKPLSRTLVLPNLSKSKRADRPRLNLYISVMATFIAASPFTEATKIWAAEPATSATAPTAPLLMPGKHTLYQRIITRPGAILSPQASPTQATPIPGFSIFYVYDRQTSQDGKTRWVQVGSSPHGERVGWIPAEKTIDWKHSLVGAFTNPAGRQRVLFLKTAEEEKKLILDPQPGQKAEALLKGALANTPGPVIALEPETYIDITHNFYLLPILDAQQIERENGPSLKLLTVISAPADHTPAPAPAKISIKDFKAGLVFVMDTTISMQPYIEHTRQAVKDIANSIKGTVVSNNFRFGLVAYRDSLKENPKLEYETKTYALPDFSQPIDSINTAIASVHDAPSSSASFDEDALAGIKKALDDVNWASFAGRYIVLVTDAGAREADDPHSLTKMDIEGIRQLAQSKGVALFVIHLLTPAGQKNADHSKAARQYQQLSKFGTAGSLYFPVKDGSPQEFDKIVQTLSTSLLQQVADTTGQKLAGLAPKTTTQEDQKKIDVVAQAMKLAYLGDLQHTSAPDVIQSFTTDRDLADPAKQSIQVRILLTRNQLSDLAQALQTILTTGLAGRTEPQTFFTQLRSAFAAAARDPSQIAHAERIGDLLGEYLDGLPYKPDLMTISQQDWLAMGAIAQRTVLNRVESRLRLYQAYQSQPDLWVQLGGSHDPGEAVYPVPLEALP